MGSPRFDRVLRTGTSALSAGSTAATSVTSRLAKQAGPAFGRVAQAVRTRVPPAYEKARQLLVAATEAVAGRARQALQRARDESRSRRARPAHPAATKPSRAARRALLAQLEELGHREVEDLLARTSSPHAGPHDQVHFVDAGIAHGKTRYPTRQFVLDWLGGDEAPADIGLWRISALVVIGFGLFSLGMLAVLV